MSASAAQLQTEKSDVRHELTGTTIENLPLPGYRNYQSLLSLVPGAHAARVSERRRGHARPRAALVRERHGDEQ